MDFQNIFKMECYKTFHRKSTRLLLIFCILPLFYGIGNMLDFQGVTIEGHFSAVTFGSMCWSLLGLTGVTNVIFIILTANYFGNEKEMGQIKFLVLESCDRKKTIWGKFSVMFLQIFQSYLLMYVTSVLVYYGFIAGEEYGSMLVGGMEDILICFSTDILYMIQLLIVVSIEIMLCMYYKSSTSLLLGITISYLFIVLQYVPFVKFADPIYLVELFNDSKISTEIIAIYVLIYLLICYFILVCAEKKFERDELK